MPSAPSTLPSPATPRPSWPTPREPVPRIVAESLAEIHDPLETVLTPVPAASAAEVARAIARSLAPLEAAVAPPPWLRPAQVASFRRVLAALERHGGALLADPIGSGKTFIALAVARTLADSVETAVFAPAVLRRQWETTAARLGIPVRVMSHEAVSRRPPEEFAGRLVVIDESHRFRNPDTRRYAFLAPWLVGRRVLLLSATPVVNRPGDLAAQLLLAVRDDALAARGCRSLGGALLAGTPPPALGDLVLCRPRPMDVPHSRRVRLGASLDETEHRFLARVERLALSRDRGVAALIRTVLLRALASSPAAFSGTLSRYELLLHHATAAAGTGRRLGRRAVHLFTGEDCEQLAFWELLPEVAGPVDLVLDDRAPLVALLGEVREYARQPDDKCRALRGLLADGETTVVFTTSRDTLAWLRHLLADLRPAWVTGSEAGIGPARLARSDVLSWFGPARPEGGRGPIAMCSRPRLLLTTDVAAEGLDLQGAGRVVHYDLPWTSVRLDQRSGRAVRLGSQKTIVDIVEFSPPPAIEARLRQLERLASKRRLAASTWTGDDGHWLYRWRAELAQWAGVGPTESGMAVIAGNEPGWLVGLAIDRLDSSGARLEAPADLIWLGERGVVLELPEEPLRFFAKAEGTSSRPPSDAERRLAVAALLPVVRGRLRAAMGEGWQSSRPTCEMRALRRRLARLAGEAARRRDRRLLDLLDRMMGWAAGGLTAGESALLGTCRRLRVRDLEPALERLLRRPRERWVPVPRLTGVIRVISEPDS